MMNYNKLSRIISQALRHEPEKYNIIIDKNGWANVGDLIIGIQKHLIEYESIRLEDIQRAISFAEKKRHELKDGMIRAIYGHSINIEVKYEEQLPPDVLYHGTSEKAYGVILAEGLKSMQRKYVHLSSVKKDAYEIGKRKEECPVILRIDSGKAYKSGVCFFYTESNIWLTEFVPIEFIDKE